MRCSSTAARSRCRPGCSPRFRSWRCSRSARSRGAPWPASPWARARCSSGSPGGSAAGARRSRVLAIDASLMSLSTFVGCVTGSVPWLHFAVLCVWALAGGLLVALGNRGGAVGTQSIIAFVVFGRFSQPAGRRSGSPRSCSPGASPRSCSRASSAGRRRCAWQRHATADAYRALSRLATASAESSTLPAADRARRGAGHAVVADAVRGSGADDAAQPGQRRAANAGRAERDPLAGEAPAGRRQADAAPPIRRLRAPSGSSR